MIQEEQVMKELRDIYSRVPKEWKSAAVTTTSKTPQMAFIVDKALEDPNFPEEKKIQLRELKEAGTFDKQQYTENPAIVKKIDNFVNREIKKAVKEGRLPNKKKLTELKTQWQNQKNSLSKN